jgi:hypothetical protein
MSFIAELTISDIVTFTFCLLFIQVELACSTYVTLSHLFLFVFSGLLPLIGSPPRRVENIGVEPMTSCVQGRRSSQLS